MFILFTNTGNVIPAAISIGHIASIENRLGPGPITPLLQCSIWVLFTVYLNIPVLVVAEENKLHGSDIFYEPIALNISACSVDCVVFLLVSFDIHILQQVTKPLHAYSKVYLIPLLLAVELE